MHEVVDCGQLWWEQVSGPYRVMQGIVKGLLDVGMVVLAVPGFVPWEDELNRSVEFAYRDTESEFVMDVIDVHEACGADGGDVGWFLLERFAPVEVAQGYRPSAARSMQQYMAEKGVFGRHVILWLKRVPTRGLGKWCEFLGQYLAVAKDGSMKVIVEVGSGGVGAAMMHLKGEAELVDYGELVGVYDALLYNSLMVGRKDGSAIWKRYLAMLVTGLCGGDVERSCLIVEGMDGVMEEGMMSYLGEMMRGGANEEEIERRVWEAQLQVAYPMIEQERVRFVEKWYGEIEQGVRLLGSVEQFNERVREPVALELGSLCGMVRVGVLKVDGEANGRLFELYHLRNRLAHMKVCGQRELRELFERYGE